jgi:hypothetical protein
MRTFKNKYNSAEGQRNRCDLEQAYLDSVKFRRELYL